MKKRILCFCLCLYCIGLWAANASFKKTGNDLLFLLPQGNVKLEFCTDDMFRVRHSQGTVFAENEQWMVRKYDFTPVHYTVEDKGAAWLITTGKLIIEATKNPFCLTVSDKNGKLLYTELAEQRFYKDSVKTKAVLQPDEHFFGFGERMDFMDQRGRKVYLNVELGRAVAWSFLLVPAKYLPVICCVPVRNFPASCMRPESSRRGGRLSDAHSSPSPAGPDTSLPIPRP